MAAYELEGQRWGTGAFGTSGGTVTWALEGTVPASFASYITTAFADWSAVANISFQRISSPAAADISFRDTYIDGLGNTLAETNYYYRGSSFESATIAFDSAEGWRSSGDSIVSARNADLFVVALHEIGHAIGLDHYDGTAAVMNTYLDRTVTDLTASDISGVQALYGARAAVPVPTATVVAAPTVVPAAASVDQQPGPDPVYRFYDTGTGDHFYTTSPAERAQILATMPWYVDEGSPWSTPDDGPNTRDVFRFYDTATGDHFFTADLGERDQIIATLPTYQYEGVAFEAYTSLEAAGPGGVALQRFYNAGTGHHHFAANATEADSIRQGQVGPGWIDEGIGLIVHVQMDGLHIA